MNAEVKVTRPLASFACLRCAGRSPERRRHARGLANALNAVLSTASPDALSICEIGWALQLRHGLTFETPQEFATYLDNTVKSRIRDLFVMMGLVESLED